MNQIHLGDCLEVLKTLPDASVDMVLCDPPYGTTACKWDTVIPFAPFWEQLHRVAKPTAAICMFGSEPFSSALRMSNIKRFKYDWVWDKKFSGCFATAKFRPLKTFEMISVFATGRPSYVPQMVLRDFPITSGKRANPRHTNEDSKQTLWVEKKKKYTHKYPTAILNFPRRLGEKVIHPTQKPVALLEYLIRTYTNEGAVVLDPTMGSGSTGVACFKTGRNFIGIEREPEYFKIAEARMKAARI